MQLTKNFALSEFDCKDGTPVPEELIPVVKELAENLQILRDYLRVPLRINSAYRTPEYNSEIGGASRSQHLKGTAADIVATRHYTAAQVHKSIELLIETGKMKEGGLGKYNSFTHYDIRGTKARWNG